MKQIKPFYFDLTPDEIRLFAEESGKVLQSGRLILGDQTRRFEQEFAEFVGVRHAISVNSGSSALQFLLRIKNVAGKTVLVATNTNFATVAAVLRAGGQVRYLDMDENTFAPTLELVRRQVESGGSAGAPIAGVLWVHIGGVVSPEFPAVVAYCRARGLFVFEDAAHAHGSAINGAQAGNLADGGAFSFFATKVMTTGEGGMITTNSDEEDYLARSLRNQGKRGMDFGGLHTDFGDSSRITEIGAVLGWLQLRKLPAMIHRRQVVYNAITAALDRAGIRYVSTRHMSSASQYKLIVLLPEGKQPGAVKEALAERGVVLGGTVYELPCHLQPVFQGLCPSTTLPVAERWCPNHICPPITSGMTEEEGRTVGEALVDVLG